MRNKKKWMAVLLSLCVSVGAVPNAALAEGELYAAEETQSILEETDTTEELPFSEAMEEGSDEAGEILEETEQLPAEENASEEPEESEELPGETDSAETDEEIQDAEETDTPEDAETSEAETNSKEDAEEGNAEPSKETDSLSAEQPLEEEKSEDDTELISFIASGDYNVTTLEDGTISIVKYIGSDTNVVIPSEIDGKIVSTIGENAFFDQTRIESITIPDTVTSIESGAFVNCINLASLDMPDSVTVIGEYLFGRCTSLVSVSLSHSLTAIPTNTFYNCPALRDVTIPEGVTTMGEAVFAYCTGLDTVILPDTLETIGEGIFYEAKALSVTMTAPVIGKNVFQNTEITDLIFTDNLTRIEAGAFLKAEFAEIDLPATVSYIDLLAFGDTKYTFLNVDENNPYYCSENNALYNKDKTVLLKYPNYKPLEQTVIKIPDTVTTIADYAFYNVSRVIDENNLDDNTLILDLPSSLESIGSHAFYDCHITELAMPEGLEEIAASLFEQAIDISVIELKEGVKSISANAFYNTYSLKKLMIPASVTTIDPTAFGKCVNLRELTIAEGNPNFRVKDGCLYDAAGETLLIYLPSVGKEEEDDEETEIFAIPDGTKAIGEKAFYGCGLKQVIIPASVTAIGEKAFYGCDDLLTFDIPSTVTFLGDKCVGFIVYDHRGNETPIKDFRIVAEPGSAAAEYALKNKLTLYTEERPETVDVIEMKTGDTIRLDQKGIVPESVWFTSENERIAYCDQDGNVKALAPGSTRIIMSWGMDNVFFEIHVTGEAIDDGHLPIDIEIGKDYNYDPSEYTIFMEKEEWEAYLDNYIRNNPDVSYDPLDNECIICYSGSEYPALLAARGEPFRVAQVSTNPAQRHPELFNLISDGLYEELGAYHASQNAVLYRGTKNAAEITGTGISVEDMKNSIGKIFASKTNLSATLSHATADRFAGEENTGAVLEIYAKKELLNGAYIDGISSFEGEKEYLINEGTKFLILDAGVRGYRWNEFWDWRFERYFKLLLLENDITKISVNLIEPNPGEELSVEGDIYGKGLTSDKVTAVWTVDEQPVSGAADYQTEYSTKLIFEPAIGYAFTDLSSIYINGDQYDFELCEDGSAMVNYVYATTGANVARINSQKTLDGVENGLPLGNTVSEEGTIASRLPKTTTAVVNGNVVTEEIAWDLENVTYDPSDKEEQTFTVYGTIAFSGYPQEQLNFAPGLDNVITCVVTVNAEEADEPAVTPSPEPTKAPEATVTPEPTKAPEATATPEPTKAPEATVTPEPTKAPEATVTPEPPQTVTPAPSEGTVTGTPAAPSGNGNAPVRTGDSAPVVPLAAALLISMLGIAMTLKKKMTK